MNTLASAPRRLIFALVAAGALGATGAGLVSGHHARAAVPATPAIVAQAPLGTAGALPSFAQITAQNGPAVVNISVTGTSRAGDEEETADGQPAARQRQAPHIGKPQHHDGFLQAGDLAGKVHPAFAHQCLDAFARQAGGGAERLVEPLAARTATSSRSNTCSGKRTERSCPAS